MAHDILAKVPKLKVVLEPAIELAKRNSPQILLATGIAGFVTTVVVAVKTGPTITSIHSFYKNKRNHEADPEARMHLIENEARDLVKPVVPLVLMTGASIGCVIGSSHIQAKRGAALMAAYSLSEKTFETYKEKVLEKLGEDGEREIMQETSDKIAKEEVPFDEDYSYSVGPDGKVLCYDVVTGKFFHSTKEEIREAEGAINKRLINESIVPLSYFFMELGIEDHSEVGEALGWDITRATPDIYFTSMLDDQSRPCLVLNYHTVLIDPGIFGRKWR